MGMQTVLHWLFWIGLAQWMPCVYCNFVRLPLLCKCETIYVKIEQNTCSVKCVLCKPINNCTCALLLVNIQTYF